MTDRSGGAPALHLAGETARFCQRRSDNPAAGAVGHRDERVERGGVVSEAAATERDLAAHPLRGAAFQPGAPLR